MEIKVHTKNVRLSNRLEEHIHRKVERLDRYLPKISDARMELRTEGRNEQPVAQLTIRSERGLVFRAEDKKQDDIYSAIDMVVDKLYRQVQRYKTKRQRARKGARRWNDIALEEIAIAVPDEADEVEETTLADEELFTEVIRRKTLELEPMNEEEAIERAELIGHNFFVFLNADTNQVNVLYQREDGNYGILIATK